MCLSFPLEIGDCLLCSVSTQHPAPFLVQSRPSVDHRWLMDMATSSEVRASQFSAFINTLAERVSALARTTLLDICQALLCGRMAIFFAVCSGHTLSIPGYG